MVYDTYNYSYWGLYTNKHHWGASHCIYIYISKLIGAKNHIPQLHPQVGTLYVQDHMLKGFKQRVKTTNQPQW
jgi:hypothetical protein